MKRTLLILSFISLTQFAEAQMADAGNSLHGNPGPTSTANHQAAIPTGNGRISGTVTDAENGEGVSYATVALTDPSTGKPLDGTVCDDKGRFQLKGIAPGTYTVTISFIGYQTLQKTGIVITDKGNIVELGTLLLASEARQLDEVVVEAQKALIEEKVDRTIYNAENDQTTRGGNATDVLRRVPMLSVDLDGNVSLRGSQNIMVLIDNKPSTIAASSIADALKQIPADQIKSVEVITSPSAKYDAEGTGGIINIITKKNNLQGATLSVDASAGLRGSNLGLNGSLRRGKMGLTLGGFGRSGYNISGSYLNEQLTRSPQSSMSPLLTTQEASTRNNMLFGRYSLGWDYDINKYNWVSASIRYGTWNSVNYQDKLFSQTFQQNELLQSSMRDVHMSNLSGTVDLSLNYTRTFLKPRRELSLMALYSRNNRTNDFVNNILDPQDHMVMSRLKNENQSFNQEVTVQTDYQTPIGDTQMFEIGAKNITRRVSSDFQYFVATGADGAFNPAEGSRLGNVFDYDQNVSAAYVSYTLSFLKNYSFKPGFRYEYTTIQAQFQDGQEVDIPAYGVLVPSINLSRKLNNGNMVKAAYNRRIQRPSLQFLNPNLQAANPLNITQGNPELAPEFTNNFELSYSTFFKNTTLNFSGYMRNTTGSIQPVRSVLGQDTIMTTYRNIGQEDAYGLSIFTNLNLSNKFTLNGGLDTYYAVLDNNVSDPLYNASNTGLVWSGRMFGNYNFTKTWGVQFFGFYRGRQVNLQGYQGGFGIYSLSLRKEFNEKKGSIGFGAENFLARGMTINSEVNSPLISQSSTNVMHNMNFKVNFSYRIGKLNADPRPRRRKSINNNDMKDGDSNEGQGGGIQ